MPFTGKSSLVYNLAFIAIFIAACLIMVFGVPRYIEQTGRTDLYFMFTSVALLSIASAGVWITFFIGRINIGQGAYALAGGYVSAILVMKYGFSFWLTLPIAGLFCAVASILIGLPILRLRGVYFAMITLVLTEVAKLLALALPITNGASGIVNIPLPSALKIFGLTLIPDFERLENVRFGFYILSLVCMVLTYAVVYRLTHSRMGQLCRSLQQNEELASSIGINIAKLRIIAYAISSCFGGIAGSIFIAISQSVYPSSFAVNDSINFMLNCFMGGLGYVLGPLLGTFILYFGWNWLYEAGKYQLLIYSTIMILLMVFLPNGLLSLRFSSFQSKSKS